MLDQTSKDRIKELEDEISQLARDANQNIAEDSTKVDVTL